MSQAMIRISERTREVLREIAQADAESMQTVLEKAVEAYRRRHFLEQVNRAYAALRQDPEAWNEEMTERFAWDEALADGLPVETGDRTEGR